MQLFLDALRSSLAANQILVDPLSRHAYAHDASAYLLIPQGVVIVDTEAEMVAVLRCAAQYHVALTFRAAGTSLEGQAQSDSVLVVLGQGWRDYSVLEAGEKIRLQPGVIGSEANLFLVPFARRLGPDPLSLSAAKIGGIAATNAHGLARAIQHNSYHTLAGMRIIFANGVILDTENAQSIQDFTRSEAATLQTLETIRTAIRQDAALTKEIRQHASHHNVLGLQLNAFLDFTDPIAILSHLMIGAEGTLGFIAEITYHTLPLNLAQAGDAGSLKIEREPERKVEYGTGRSLTPFVAEAWGEAAYQIMVRIKALLDPQRILNPEIIFSANPSLHLQHLKVTPKVDPLIDRCTECGFCEKVCPSNKLTLTPRQRIVALRDMQRLDLTFADFQYRGLDTCAATGLCKTRCPVGINIGDIVRKKRFQAQTSWQRFYVKLWIKHFAKVMRVMRFGLKFRLLLRPIPRDKARYFKNRDLATKTPSSLQPIYYFPSCAERLFDHDQHALLLKILAHLGFELITLPQANNACCGLMFKSRGYLHEAVTRSQQLEKMLRVAPGPILCEMGSCVLQMKQTFRQAVPVYDVLDFLADRLADYPLIQHQKTVMLHVTCSMQRLGLHTKMLRLAERCVTEVKVPPDIHCCGFAGEKGLTHPELTASALSGLKAQIPPHCKEGYSMSLTCEMGLSKASGIAYRSLLYLIYDSLLK